MGSDGGCGSEFLKYLITVAIDIMISIPIFIRYKETQRDKNVFRDKAIKLIISVVTFFLYANMTRFEWAYSGSGKYDMLMIVFLVASSLSFLNTTVNPHDSFDMARSSGWYWRLPP